MSVVPAITSAITKFSGKPLAVVSKTLAVATVASVLYDAHSIGKEHAWIENQENIVDRYRSQYQQYATMEGDSSTVAKLKNWWFDTQRSFTFLNYFDNAIGYTKGFVKSLGKNLPFIGLAAIALKCKTAGKVAGVMLLANGIKTLAYDVFGIGSPYKNKYK